MRTSEVLNRAADLIEERGWGTGDWANAGDLPLCIEGAIAAAMGFVSQDGRDVMEAAYCPATQAVRQYVDRWPSIWNDRLMHDLVGLLIDSDSKAHGVKMRAIDEYRAEANAQGKAKVVATLRAVALIEASRESELSDADLQTIADQVGGDVIDGRLMVDMGEETVTFVAHAPARERVSA